MSTHHIVVCKHGFTIRQCRCPSLDKTRIVNDDPAACPPACREYHLIEAKVQSRRAGVIAEAESILRTHATSADAAVTDATEKMNDIIDYFDGVPIVPTDSVSMSVQRPQETAPDSTQADEQGRVVIPLPKVTEELLRGLIEGRYRIVAYKWTVAKNIAVLRAGNEVLISPEQVQVIIDEVK